MVVKGWAQLPGWTKNAGTSADIHTDVYMVDQGTSPIVSDPKLNLSSRPASLRSVGGERDERSLPPGSLRCFPPNPTPPGPSPPGPQKARPRRHRPTWPHGPGRPHRPRLPRGESQLCIEKPCHRAEHQLEPRRFRQRNRWKSSCQYTQGAVYKAVDQNREP